MGTITWEDCVELAPFLRTVENAAVDMNKRGQQDWHSYEALKRQAKLVVGWGAKIPELATTEAYDVVMSHLLDVWELPTSTL